MEAILALEDGTLFRGRAFGATGERTGEVVFNTSMTGYQEILSDPSYRGQIVVMTAPEIGNVGTNGGDSESEHPQVEGFAVRELSEAPSNWRSTQALQEHLREHRIPGIAELDTRALTRHLRSRGVLKGVLSSARGPAEDLVRRARLSPGLETIDLVAKVTCPAPYAWDAPREGAWAEPFGQEPGAARIRCVAYDLGAKRNIFRLLHEAGFDVTVVPATFSANDALALAPEALFFSNGPGDPATATYVVEAVRGLVGRLPAFGICLGHQIAARALGASTFKLKFGHRGANHPVQDLRTGRVSVTSQNHGYAVDPATLPAGVAVTHVNLNDGTCEGFFDEARQLLAVQYHPEASPGPHDALGLFGEFRRLAERARAGAVAGKGAR
ncbi:MAG TPA: glutamine-hydrolyzing carbamoyl-phosphate synthase small subunit [Candidatus Polarisedimenticolaceae bacterium]|nr:glutamine-hydrolyzing carbamoyl-phosphate synthase small subunit [Candidatus Polarisedimenticolaceae bacterium]